MITQTFPPTRAVPAIPFTPNIKSLWYTPQETQQASMRKITPAEYLRRDEIIRRAVVACPFKAGDTVFPASLKDYEKYGAFIVSGILTNYKDTANDYEWSKTDNPLIITIKSLKDLAVVMFCSSTWLVKTNTHLSMEVAV